MKYGLKIAIAGAVLALLSACSILATTDASVNAGVQAVVEFGTAKYIEGAGTVPGAQLARAIKIKAVAVELEGVANGNITLAQLEASLAASIAKLPVSDQILANELVVVLTAQVQLNLNSGVLGSAAVASAKTVIGYVITAATLYGAP